MTSARDFSWATRFENLATEARTPMGEIAELGRAAGELLEPAQEVAVAAGEVLAVLDIMAFNSGHDLQSKVAARENLREAAGKLAAALRELRGVMSR